MGLKGLGPQALGPGYGPFTKSTSSLGTEAESVEYLKAHDFNKRPRGVGDVCAGIEYTHAWRPVLIINPSGVFIILASEVFINLAW